jgi:hypothetical protein
MAKPLKHAEQVEAKSRDQLRQWLKQNYQRNEGVWLVFYQTI